MNTCQLAFAYLVSFFGGWLVAGLVVWSLRRKTDDPRPFFRGLDLWIGGLERIISTTLVIWTPPLLPIFVGGWMAMKFAANWQRQQNSPTTARGSLIFLVGSTLSFGVAVAAGIWVNPGAVARWANPN